MSVADQDPASPKISPPTRLTVRVTPELTQVLTTASQGVPTLESQSRAQGAGLLFGTTEKDFISVRACKSFAFWQPSQNNSPATHPELSGLELIGWYCARHGGVGLLPRDVQFHNRHFPRTTDLMLIINAERERGPLLELFARSSNAPLSTEHFRRGSFQLGAESPATQPIEVNLEENDKEDKLAEAETAAPAPSIPPANVIALLPTPAPPETNGLLWVISAALFVIAVGMTVAWVHARAQHFALTQDSQSVMRQITPTSGFRMLKSGDGALLSWNHNSSAVRSAKQGILHIRDGSEQRTIYLDPNDLANGSIVYQPQSNSAKFRLELLGEHGSPLSDDVQAFEGTNPTVEPDSPKIVVRAAHPLEAPERTNRETHEPAPRAAAALAVEPEKLPNYVPARALKQVLPDTKLFAVSDIREGAEVDVQVRIDDKGGVTEAHVKNGINDNGSLRSAALEAARQWTFESAKIGSKNIPSDHTIAFQFHP